MQRQDLFATNTYRDLIFIFPRPAVNYSLYVAVWQINPALIMLGH